ncbi:hypothetical protein [Allocoleopsis franciscana]|uniref:hypothetical protein n=1 Tax=Allocoleopsis franciscana TaxID=2886352 RepID=UPI0005A26AFA|nr:hypothetical protein [Allocoleopsis franciscana]
MLLNLYFQQQTIKLLDSDVSPAKATAGIGAGFHLLETTRKGTAVKRSDIGYMRDSVSAAARQIAPLRSLQNLHRRWHSMVNSLEQHQLRLSAFRWLDHFGAQADMKMPIKLSIGADAYEYL